MSDNPIDVSYKDINKKYYTIDEVSNILQVDQSKIVFYFEKLNDFLNIASVGMYQLFDDKDIENLKIIHKLEEEKHMSLKEIRIYLNSNKQEIIIKKEPNNKIDQSVLNIFQTFANALMDQNSKIDTLYNTNIQLVESMKNLSEHQVKIENELIEQRNLNQEQSKEHIENIAKLSTQLNEVKEELAITKEINEKIEKHGQQIQENFDEMNNKSKERDIKIVEDLYKKLEDRRKESEEHIKPKSFIEKVLRIIK